MIATSVAYDLVLLVHIIAAVATVIVLVTMRYAGLAVARGADALTQARHFPPRRNSAARVLHLLPVTGLIMSFSGGSSVALSRPWVGVGVLCYLAAAGHLEARTLPQERAVAATIKRDGVASIDQGRQLVRSMDVLLGLIAVALVSMLVQF
ncbi:MAG TPA: hypothetical protein VNF08_03360 [Acidimicrobiales bacterium]|nr:hypothetical protein [Acidimicrobiales bacterium]